MRPHEVALDEGDLIMVVPSRLLPQSVMRFFMDLTYGRTNGNGTTIGLRDYVFRWILHMKTCVCVMLCTV